MAPREIHLHLIDISVSFHRNEDGKHRLMVFGRGERARHHTLQNKYVHLVYVGFLFLMKSEQGVFMLIQSSSY